MRFVVVGAGAIGGVVGGRLFQHGHDVVLVARGAHGDAMAARGLRLEDPDRIEVLRVPVAATIAEASPGPHDVVLMAVKSQDTAEVLRDLADTGAATPVVCVQNGVANERAALRLFPRVLGVSVMVPAAHLEPGVVQTYAAPLTGLLDVGRYPHGTDDVTITVTAALAASSFDARPSREVMRWKYRKLLLNLGNAVQALCGPGRGQELVDRAREEGEACLAAAGIAHASVQEDAERRAELIDVRPIAGRPRGGGSTWQSLARGAGSVETDHLNGEVVLLGRLHGVPTPVNGLLQRTARHAARHGKPPGSLRAEDLLAEVG